MSRQRRSSISASMHWFSGIVEWCPTIWRWLGNLETQQFQSQIQDIGIDRPVYISGLARSGSTILLEMLAEDPCVATHRYADFPALHTPIWWSQARGPTVDSKPTERAHQDGILVTTQSPEAMEEALWQAFFPEYYRNRRILPFEIQTLLITDGLYAKRFYRFREFYRDHLRKLLWLRGGQRYVAKGNNNFSRFNAINKIVDDARLIIPVRHPLHHIASLQKQHQLFSALGKRDAPTVAHLRRMGHFEFGLDRRPLHLSSDCDADEIHRLWNRTAENGREDPYSGWAYYWAGAYQWIFDNLVCNEDLSDRVLVVRHEDLCDSSLETIQRVQAFCELESEDLARRWSQRLQRPTYYAPTFTPKEVDQIRSRTASVAALFGYDADDWKLELQPKGSVPQAVHR